MSVDVSYEITLAIADAVMQAKRKLYQRLGFLRGKIPVYINVDADFLNFKLSQFPQLPEELIEEARQYDADALTLLNQIKFCKQTFSALAFHCESSQEFVDALPDCILREVFVSYQGYPRLKQPYEIYQDNPAMKIQLEKAVDILRTYQVLKLIEGD